MLPMLPMLPMLAVPVPVPVPVPVLSCQWPMLPMLVVLPGLAGGARGEALTRSIPAKCEASQ